MHPKNDVRKKIFVVATPITLSAMSWMVEIWTPEKHQKWDPQKGRGEPPSDIYSNPNLLGLRFANIQYGNPDLGLFCMFSTLIRANSSCSNPEKLFYHTITLLGYHILHYFIVQPWFSLFWKKQSTPICKKMSLIEPQLSISIMWSSTSAVAVSILLVGALPTFLFVGNRRNSHDLPKIIC